MAQEVVAKSGTGKLSAQDWARAALKALGEGGLAAVAIEPLAKRLGATKGSFYWHFKDRAALVDAVLVLWEQLGTQQIIEDLDRLPDPADRLRQLLTHVIDYAAHGREELALLASVDQPAVAAAMNRVTRRRIAYVAEQLRELGVPESQAHLRASVAVSIYHGLNQLARITPETLPATDELVDLVIARLLDSHR